MLVLEVKGKETDESRAKRQALKEWCEAVNAHGGFGTWQSAVSYHPNDLEPMLRRTVEG